MINLTLTPTQRAAVKMQRARPFKFLMDQPYEFDRVYAYSCWVDATILNLINPKARTVIDIGCGQAGVAAIQNIIYDCEVYLIDGNRAGQRECGYGSADTMIHYSTWNDLPETLKRWGCNMSKVHFISIEEAPDYVWPNVDLIQSTLSCGTHYPIATYNWLYNKVNHSETRYCFQVGGGTPVEIPPEFTILKEIPCINFPGSHYAVLSKQT
jgi:hypothetical protein